jgi:hypothetical protein
MMVVMERTQANLVLADFFQHDAVGGHDLHNVSRPFDLLKVHFHCREIH